MISYFAAGENRYFAIESSAKLSEDTLPKLHWLLGTSQSPVSELKGKFIGPRIEMITPWSTNAVEITQNMGILGISRIEQLFSVEESSAEFDPMTESLLINPSQESFLIHHDPENIEEIHDIAAYNSQEGLALSEEEIQYLEDVSKELGRPLTDSEVFGFSQVNSEHCRHKIFNGTFIIDGEEKEESLFRMIRNTSKENPNFIVSAYKDNVAFIEGPTVDQFAPERQEIADIFGVQPIESIISLKAETHNFPTTVEPFNGAATGSGGEIRDRLAGGRGSLPLAGTAVYMSSYTRLEKDRPWEKHYKERPWLYQSPVDILIKASDGASDFGNKFGQPLIAGSVLTFEHFEEGLDLGFDKVIMLAGGIGFGKKDQALKGKVEKGDRVVLLGGDNYRIGMGGGAVSSVATGEFDNAIELNAVQRSNPEMQKRAMNVIRALHERKDNPIVSIHDHGAGGHLNCLSELLEETGGEIEISKLPVGDPTLSEKEIIGNESQERMGLVVKEKDLDLVQQIADRERSPYYVIGTASDDMKFSFKGLKGKNPIDWELRHMFGSSPKTILEDKHGNHSFRPLNLNEIDLISLLKSVLQLESVACKDWLTNKVDRSVSGKVATQQTCGELQLPLNNVGVMAMDFTSHKGIATSIGHSPVSALIDPEAGSRLSIVESLTNLIWAPLTHGLKGVSLSANWMWPAKVNKENDRLYRAVKAASEFAIDLGINIPTGKDSLSMTQKYSDGQKVYAPGTVIISTVGEVSDIRKTVTTDLKEIDDSVICHISLNDVDLTLGGSAAAQVLGTPGQTVPDLKDAGKLKEAFLVIGRLIQEEKILAGHDISSGGLITSLLEMCFPSTKLGMDLEMEETDGDLLIRLFSEAPGLLVQVRQDVVEELKNSGLEVSQLGKVSKASTLSIKSPEGDLQLDVAELRDTWYKTSHLMDLQQREEKSANSRFENYKKQPLDYIFPKNFSGKAPEITNIQNKPKAAILREKGINGDREMAWALYAAGFEVKDIHMTDLINGREDLSDVKFIVFTGGFSNSDVLGSAKGWAGAFLYNDKARKALDDFYARPDTLSLGVCNGCQLMMELGLIMPDVKDHPKMKHNASGKFESSFVSLDIPESPSILMKSLSKSKLGVWLAHGEGRFDLQGGEGKYAIAARYAYESYPANPNGSDEAIAAISSTNGRHLAIMPHLERSLYPWNWPHYPQGKTQHEISPWVEAFLSARSWVENI